MTRATLTPREERGMAVPAVQSLTDFANPAPFWTAESLPYTGGTPVLPSYFAKRTRLIHP